MKDSTNLLNLWPPDLIIPPYITHYSTDQRCRSLYANLPPLRIPRRPLPRRHIFLNLGVIIMADEQPSSSKDSSKDSSKELPSKESSPSPVKMAGMTVEDLFKKLILAQSVREKPQKSMDEYKFWKTQPVPKFGQKVEKEGEIEFKTVDEVPNEPAPLPTGFEWSTIDITDPTQVNEVYELLFHNYIEDDDENFRFRYSATFLDWALKPPGWHKEWNVAVRVKGTGKLVGFISGIPQTLRVRDRRDLQIAEINYLCVHKKLRSKRLAPVLIREVTRRVNRKGVWQALYTASAVLPSPISTCRYYHRSINWPKLYDVGFSPLPANSTPAKQVAKYALPNEPTLPTLRPMKDSDVLQVHRLLNKYLDRFDLAPVLSETELHHWMLDSVHTKTEDRAVYSYVVTDPKDDSAITDFFSFYHIDCTVSGNANHDSLKIAYAFYYATMATEPEATLKSRLITLFQNALIIAKQYEFDVFNAMTLQDNPLFLEDLKFGAGDGLLNYYLFNYRAFPVHGGINSEKRLEQRKDGGVGVVLL